MKRIPLPLLPLLLLPLCLASTGAMETLRLDFSKERSAVVGGVVHAPEPEMLRNGELAVGARGFSLPAAPLLGENEGTILFRVRFEEPREPRNTMRSLVTLRTNSRLYAGYYFFGDRRWAFVFSDQDKTFRMEMPDPLEPGKDYRLGFSWDGETLKLFRDGRLLAQTEQPLPASTWAPTRTPGLPQTPGATTPSSRNSGSSPTPSPPGKWRNSPGSPSLPSRKPIPPS